MDKLSIITPVFNRGYLLHYHLYSLSRQTFPFETEILVVNDGIPGCIEDICKRFPKLNIRYIFTGKRNIGREEPIWRVPGFAINIGAKLSTGNYLLVTGADIFVVEEDTVAGICGKLYTNQYKSKTTNNMVTCEGKDDDGSFLKTTIRSKNLDTPTIMDAFNKLASPLYTEQPFFMAFPRQPFIDIGGYDEDFIGIGWDDTDFVKRMTRRGSECVKIQRNIIHMYHERQHCAERIQQNKLIFDTKKKNKVANLGREWGVL